MGNLSHYAGSSSGTHHTGSNNPGSPGETPDHGAGAAADGYASEDFVPGSSSSSRERKKGLILQTKLAFLFCFLRLNQAFVLRAFLFFYFFFNFFRF